MSPSDFSPFFRRLVERRDRLNLSQSDMAQKLGKSQGAISRLERGDLVESRELAHAYAEALGDGLVLGVDISVGQLWRILRNRGGASCLVPRTWLDELTKREIDARGSFEVPKTADFVAAEAAKYIGYAASPWVALQIYDSLEGNRSRARVGPFDWRAHGFKQALCKVTLVYEPVGV